MDHLQRSSRNAFVNDLVDRVAERRGDAEWLSQLMEAADTRFMPVWRSQCLITRTLGSESPVLAVEMTRQQALPLLERAIDIVFLGISRESGARFALNLPNTDESVQSVIEDFGEFEDLRAASRQLSDPQAGLLAYAKALSDWQDKHRFCGLCGQPTTSQSAGHVLKCTGDDCGRSHFPRLDPAVIVSVTIDESILLGRQAAWVEHQYSVVAGFVEAGESLEQAVVREVMEETGVKVDSVSYHSSQPWPFPNSIMLGFAAQARSSTISLNDKELQHARWFTRDEIVDGLNQGTLRLPSAVSISYRLIEDWFDSANPAKCLRDSIVESGGHQWRHIKVE